MSGQQWGDVEVSTLLLDLSPHEPSTGPTKPPGTEDCPTIVVPDKPSPWDTITNS